MIGVDVGDHDAGHLCRIGSCLAETEEQGGPTPVGVPTGVDDDQFAGSAEQEVAQRVSDRVVRDRDRYRPYVAAELFDFRRNLGRPCLVLGVAGHRQRIRRFCFIRHTSNQSRAGFVTVGISLASSGWAAQRTPFASTWRTSGCRYTGYSWSPGLK